MENEFLYVNTEIISGDDVKGLERAARLIREGKLVAFPTETVYGLGASALLADAAKRVYAAKGRPSDNPLIIHLADFADAEKYCEVTPAFEKLASLFMPGPITVIAKKKSIIPHSVTGGLDTVAVRVPVHPVANKLIRLSGVPIAAPSANLSGRPSTTSADHVISDMLGRCDMIIDGGECDIGLESTIVALGEDNSLRLLRPGAVTPEMLTAAGFDVAFDKAVTEKLSAGERPEAPGMKYRHYAPGAPVTLLDGSDENVTGYMERFGGDESVALVCLYEDTSLRRFDNSFVLGSRNDPAGQAHRLFSLLRSFDDRKEIKQIYARVPDKSGIGLAVFNRMIKASGYTVLKV